MKALEAVALRSTLQWAPRGAGLEAASLRPFHTFILKIASRCNLDCSYCYVYRGADQSWRDRPRFMSYAVAKQTATRIAEHVKRHGLVEVSIVFHGGEPLLAGSDRIASYVDILKRTIPCKLDLAIQTNGTLLDEEMLTCLSSSGVNIGISLDGDELANDRSRTYRNGSSSYEGVLRAIDLINSRPDWKRLLGGYLAVIDLRNDPRAIYHAFVDLEARSIDLIWPDGHHSSPPPRPIGDSTSYGRWLASFFDCWSGGIAQIEVRFFEEMMALILGGRSSLESIGAKSVDLVIVEADGAIEAVDTLKVVGEEATSLGLHVEENALDEALGHPAIYSRMMGFAALSEQCRGCPDLEVCGGGYLPNRFSEENGFLNPSVYCDDLRFLIEHIRSRLTAFLLPG